MDLHIVGGLLSGFMTSIGCLHDVLPWSVGDLHTTWRHSSLEHWRSLDNLATFYMLAKWRRLPAWRKPCIGGGAFIILEEGVEP
jgi:hypothetical protein